MSLYDTLQKTKKELPYRFQRLQAEADAKRSEPVPYQEKDTQNSRDVSRDQGVRDSYRKRVEDDRNTALSSMGNQGVPTGQTLIEKATSGFGQAGTIPQQKSVRQYLGLDSTERQEDTPKPKSTLELLEQQREENAKKITEGVLPEKQKASFLTWLDSKAGLANRGVTKTIDVAANAIPMLEGAIMGENPDSTLTGQLLKPLTDATGKLDDWTARETENAAKLVDETIGDNQALRLASDLGGGVITALPTAALAMMTGGASAGGTIGSQLAPHASGLAATVSAAWQKLISNPMFKTSFIQSLGNGYEEAKEAGASDVNAMAAALLSTTANSIVEVGGGVETLPGELKNADLSTGKKALQWLTSALDEGKEEVVQGAISNMVNKAASGNDTPYFSMTDENAVVNPLRMAQEFGMGTAVGGILGGGQVLADSMLQKAANRSGNALDAAIQKIFDDNNKKLNIDNTESQAYNGINENGGALDGRNNQLDGASGEGVRTGRGGSWTDSGSQDGRRFGQDDLSVPGIVLLSPEAQQTLTERGIVNVELHDSSMDNTAFSAALDAARVADSQNGWAVTPKDANELTEAGTRTFLDRNGSAGFAIATDGDIEAVFANKTAGAPKGATKSTIPQAIANGGTKLDCYGHGLVRLYGRYGFIPVARVIFNPEYANPGWTADKGMPDIYFMMHNGDSADTVVQNMGKYKTWSKAELEALPLMEYDEAYKYRDSLMNSGNGGVWKLDAAIQETIKPAQELENLNNAIDGLFAQNKNAQADTGAESANVNTNPAIQTPQEQAADAMPTGIDGNSDVMDHGSVGAAESGFSPYSHFQNQTDNFLPEGANAARPVDMPAVDPTGKPVRRGAKTIYGAQTTSDARAEQMENEFMEGLYGYDPVRDKPTLEKAKYTIEQEGYDRAYARVTERLQSMKKLKETGLEAYLLYADAVKNGKDADAAELCLLLTQSGTEFGQGVQLFSMFRKLTPEGQLMGVERMVQRINDKYAGSDKKTSIPDYARNDVIKEITDVRDTALRLLENIQAVFDKTSQNHGVPVEDWIQEIGDRLAKSLEKTSENSSQLTVSKTIQNDLRRFAKSYFDRKKPGNRYSNAQALENFLNNRDQYTEAWDEARWYLSNKYKNDPSMLDALNDFLTSGINIESIGSGIDTDIKKAMNDIGVKTKDIIRKSNADKDSTSKQIAEMLMKDHNLSNEDADTMANFIIDRFNQHISDASELVLKNRFAPKDKKAKKTFEQNFYELANMGAFTNENWKDAVSKKLFGHEISIDETLISEFRNAQDQDTRDAVMEKIYENIGKQIPTTASEAINQWRYTAMLLNPSTHIKNIGGNLSMMAMKLGKDAIGTGIEAAANKITGGKVGRTKSILNVFNKSDQALMQKAWSDFENVQDDVAGIGKNKDNVMGKVGKYRDYWKLNDPQGNAAKLVDGVLRTAEKVPKFNSAMMEAEDMIFSRPDYAVSLAGYMKANKLTEITPEARAYAIKEAQKATFRDANAVSNFARKIGTGDSKFWNWIGNAIFPFKGTPANVGVRAVEYSPAGLLKAIFVDSIRLKRGTITATEFIDNLSSGLTGSALAAVGYFLAQAGFLRATGVGDEKEKEQQRQQGYKDNSFTLFGHSIPENVLTSISAPLFVGAAVYEALTTKALTGEIYSWDEVLQVLAATADPILGQTMLDGLSDTFYTIRSAQGGMGEVTAALLANTAGNYLSSLMPTILSRISSAADSVGRETYADKNKQLTGIQKEAQGLMMKSPARQMLHEKVDNYGRVQETWKPFGDDNAAEKSLNFLTNVVTPTYPSKIKDTPVEDELNRLYRSGADTSDKKIFQTEAAKSFKVDGKTINLTADQHEEFEKIRGENTMEYQGALQDSEQYNNLDDSLKVYATDKMYDFIEQTSKDLLGIGYKPADWVSELKGKSNEEIADAVIKKTIDSYAQSDNFSGKYDGITSMLDSGTIDEAMAVSLLPKEANDGYYKYIKGSGIELSAFIDVYQFKKNAKQEEVIEYINKVCKGPRQKRRMFLAMGYSEKNLPDGW